MVKVSGRLLPVEPRPEQGVTGRGCWLCMAGADAGCRRPWVLVMYGGVFVPSLPYLKNQLECGWMRDLFWLSYRGFQSIMVWTIQQAAHSWWPCILQRCFTSCCSKKQRRGPKVKQSNLQKPTSYFSSQHLPPGVSKAFSKTTTFQRADIGNRT